MANELRIHDATGLTYTCQVKEPESGGSVIGTVSLSEDGSTGDYYGTFPAASAGYYDIKYIEDSIVRRAETAYWTGSALLGDANFVTATGFSTPTNVTDAQSAIQTDIGNLNDLSAAQVNAEVDTAIADANLSTFDASTDEVTTDAASRTASQADLTGIATGANVTSAQSAIQSDISDLETHGDAEWSTATGFSTHSASDVVDAITASSATIAITSPFNAVTNSLDIIIGETLDFTITRSFSASWEYIEFVIKDRIDSAVDDDDAILKAVVNADATPAGLIVLNKQAVVGGASDAVITADQPNNTTRIKVLDGITYQLTKAAKLYFTVRWVDSSSDSQSVNGQAQAGYVAAEGGDA